MLIAAPPRRIPTANAARDVLPSSTVTLNSRSLTHFIGEEQKAPSCEDKILSTAPSYRYSQRYGGFAAVARGLIRIQCRYTRATIKPDNIKSRQMLQLQDVLVIGPDELHHSVGCELQTLVTITVHTRGEIMLATFSNTQDSSDVLTLGTRRREADWASRRNILANSI